MTPKVRIGCHYAPRQYERRMDGVYQALRPAMTADGELLQRALLSKREPVLVRVARKVLPW